MKTRTVRIDELSESWEIHGGTGDDRSLKTVLNAYDRESRALQQMKRYQDAGVQVRLYRFRDLRVVEKVDG